MAFKSPGNAEIYPLFGTVSGGKKEARHNLPLFPILPPTQALHFELFSVHPCVMNTTIQWTTIISESSRVSIMKLHPAVKFDISSHDATSNTLWVQQLELAHTCTIRKMTKQQQSIHCPFCKQTFTRRSLASTDVFKLTKYCDVCHSSPDLTR